MALKVTTLKDQEEEEKVTNYALKERLWLTADRDKAVKDGDPDAAFLLGNEGDEIPAEQAKDLGLTSTTKKRTPSKDK